ncbi:MAG: FG-GAP-like repeat-containing protein, partial [Nitrospirota bacterium]|nr:FG-GAP-like repeat-containing protein [Nitrospirota bacterium]
WTAKGDGTFDVATFRPWEGYGMNRGTWLTGDFNQDGKTDLVHAVQDTDYVHIWTAKGDGTFDIATFRPWAGYVISTGRWLTGDFNGDGRTDLFHAIEQAGYANIWASRENGGFDVTTFSPWQGYDASDGIWVVGDFTGDKMSDAFHFRHGVKNSVLWVSTWPRQNQIFLEGIEVTQSIQRMDNSVPLIAWKETVARAYFTGLFQNPRRIDATLKIKLSDGTIDYLVATGAVVDPADNFNLKRKREAPLSRHKSLVFPLQAWLKPNTRWARPGMSVTLTIFEVRDSDTGSLITCSNCNTSVTVPFIDSAPLVVDLIGFYSDKSTTAILPRDLDKALVSSWLGRAYPTYYAFASAREVQATDKDFNPTGPSDCRSVLLELETLRASDALSNDPTYTNYRKRYYGLVYDQGSHDVEATSSKTFISGCNGGKIEPTQLVKLPVAAGSTGRWNWKWDNDTPSETSYGDWYTGHELGHTFGLSHVDARLPLRDEKNTSCDDPSEPHDPYPFKFGQLSPFIDPTLSDDSGDFVGFDTGAQAIAAQVGDPYQGVAMQVLPGETYHDVMTYCRYKWLSPRTYQVIQDRLNFEKKSVDDIYAFKKWLRDIIEGISPHGGRLDSSEGSSRPSKKDPVGPQAIIGSADAQTIKLGHTEPPAVVRGSDTPSPMRQGRDLRPEPLAPAMAQAQSAMSAPARSISRAEPATLSPASIRYGLVIVDKNAAPIPVTPPFDVRTGNLVQIIASVNLTQSSGDFAYVTRVSEAVIPRSSEKTDASIRMLDAACKALSDDHPVPVGWIQHETPAKEKTGLIDAVVELHPKTAYLQLVWTGKPVSTRAVSANAPKFTSITLPKEPFHKDAVVTWVASDSDDQAPELPGCVDPPAKQVPLSYSVLLTRDEGLTWETIAMGLTNPSLHLIPDQLRGLSSLTIRVFANDGINSASKTSTTLELVKQ